MEPAEKKKPGLLTRILALAAGLLIAAVMVLPEYLETSEVVEPADSSDFSFLRKDIYINGTHIYNFQLPDPVLNKDGAIYIPLDEPFKALLGIDFAYEHDVLYLAKAESTSVPALGKVGCNLVDYYGCAPAELSLVVGSSMAEFEPYLKAPAEEEAAAQPPEEDMQPLAEGFEDALETSGAAPDASDAAIEDRDLTEDAAQLWQDMSANVHSYGAKGRLDRLKVVMELGTSREQPAAAAVGYKSGDFYTCWRTKENAAGNAAEQAAKLAAYYEDLKQSLGEEDQDLKDQLDEETAVLAEIVRRDIEDAKVRAQAQAQAQARTDTEPPEQTVLYVRLSALQDIARMGISSYYDSVGGLYISTDPQKPASGYFSKNNASYISGRIAYMRYIQRKLSYEQAEELEYLFRHEAFVNDVSEDMLMGICRAESTYNLDINERAVGIMQLMPTTVVGAGWKLEKVYTVHGNVEFGSLYITNDLKRYKYDEVLALTAYNQGVGKVASGEYSTGYASVVMKYEQGIKTWCSGKGYANGFARTVPYGE